MCDVQTASFHNLLLFVILLLLSVLDNSSISLKWICTILNRNCCFQREIIFFLFIDAALSFWYTYICFLYIYILQIDWKTSMELDPKQSPCKKLNILINNRCIIPPTNKLLGAYLKLWVFTLRVIFVQWQLLHRLHLSMCDFSSSFFLLFLSWTVLKIQCVFPLQLLSVWLLFPKEYFRPIRLTRGTQ